jgi:SprT-like family
MRITIEDLRMAYIYLEGCRPFRNWRLPCTSEIVFKVNKSEMIQGEYECDPHTIHASTHHNHTWLDVLETVAHEMVHLVCEQHNEIKHHEHDKKFKKRAEQVCKWFGWDVSTF